MLKNYLSQGIKLILNINNDLNFENCSNWFFVKQCWLKFNYTGCGTNYEIKLMYLSYKDFFCNDMTLTSFEITSLFIRNYYNFFRYLPAASLLAFYYLYSFCYHINSYYFNPSIFTCNYYIFVTFYFI